MSRASGNWVTRVWYSVLAALQGTGIPVNVQIGLLTLVFSPRSVRAMMFRVLLVVPVLLVIQISTRFTSTPVVRLGRVDIALS